MGDETSCARPAVQAVGLTVGYSPDRPVLEDVSFHIDGPGVVRLDAPNGSGKSTLIEAASGYLPPMRGKILVNGRDAGESEGRTDRRVCRATPALHPHLSLADHLALAADLAGVDRAEPLERARAYGLCEWSLTRTSALSTGTARKLWFVICTTGPLRVALLDEPFNGVDRDSVDLMVDELNAWARTALVLVVTHTAPPGLRIVQTLRLDAIPPTPEPSA